MNFIFISCSKYLCNPIFLSNFAVQNHVKHKTLLVMKKILFFVSFVLLNCASFAQVTFQHSFDENEVINTGTYDNDLNKSLIYSEDVTELYGKAYYSTKLDTLTYSIKRYNADYSVNSTKVFNIPVIPDYYAREVSISKTIFDDDASTYEMLVIYSAVNTPYNGQDRNSYQKAMIYKEDGTEIADLGVGYNLYVSSYLHIYDNEFRFYIRRTNYENTAYVSGVSDVTYFNYEIYKVNKKNTNGLQQVPVDRLPKKVLIDGNIYIIEGDKVIDTLGRVVQ